MISLTFDDGLDCHLETAIPLLERFGFRGTFFVNPGAPSFARRWEEWRQAAARGHELGNHTLFHPSWRAKSHVTEGNAVENYTLDRMRLELEAANQILMGLDGEAIRTFAYPSCNSVIGEPGWIKRALIFMKLDRTRLMGVLNRHPWLDLGSTQQSYQPLAAKLFLASRAGGDRFSAGPDFPPPRAAVPCIMLDGLGKPEIEKVLEAFVRGERGWLVFAAHGIGGGHRLSCDAGVFAWLLDTLRSRSLPVLTFRDAAQASYGNEHA